MLLLAPGCDGSEEGGGGGDDVGRGARDQGASPDLGGAGDGGEGGTDGAVDAAAPADADATPAPDLGSEPADSGGPAPDAGSPDVQPDGGGCGAGEAPAYPRDDELRLNHLQAKGTHNSYHTASELEDVPHWAYEQAPLGVQLDRQGVRQVELDVHYEPEVGFTVYHIAHLDPGTTCERFVDCLSEMRQWSDCHPGHHLLLIGVEPKDDVDRHKIIGHYDELEAEILSVWPAERLLTPDRVRGQHPSLRAALQAEGWPTLGATRGQAMLLLLDSGEHRDHYLQERPGLEGALFFTRGGQGEPWSSLIEVGDPRGRQEEIIQAVGAGYLVRSVADEAYLGDEENSERAAAALAAGAHFISSDLPAPVEGRGYSFEVPLGAPSRCNPLTAPPECTASDIEALGR